jgi:hypothetical protein
MDGHVGPWLDDGVELTSDVLHGLAHQRQQALEFVEDTLDILTKCSGSELC